MNNVTQVNFNTYTNDEVLEVKLNSTTIWQKPVDNGAYVTIYSLDNSEFTMSKYNNTKTWDGTIEYSVNKTSWTTWDGSSGINSSNGKLYLRGTNNTSFSFPYYNQGLNITSNNTNIEIAVKGNIENLLDYSTVLLSNHPTIGSSAFKYFFSNWTCLKYANELELPSTAVPYEGYSNMFNNCSNLVLGPTTLPASSVSSNGYLGMFSSCTSLTTPPHINNVLVNSYAFYQMFAGCTSLNTIPAVGGSCYGDSGYAYMFDGCTNIKLSTNRTGDYTNEYKIPNKGSSATNPFQYMFRNTGGTFTGTPNAKTTYYTSNTVI